MLASTRPIHRLRHVAAGVLLAAFVFGGCRDSPSSSERPDPLPDLLLVTIDTVRADRCSVYGHPVATTPFLEELAETGVVFDRAYSTAPWTLPSLASIHTGLYPSEHGADAAEKSLAEAVHTLAEALVEQGYQTLAVTSHAFADREHGFAQGFDRFDASQIRGHDAVTSPALTEIALRLLDDSDRSRPVFLWVHYFDPHFSYVDHDEIEFADPSAVELPSMLTAPWLNAQWQSRQARGEEFTAEEMDYITAVYDEELRYTDDWARALVRGARERRPDTPQIVAIAADHGEYFLERGRFFHGQDVYDELVRVPLVLGGDLPDRWRGRRVAAPVSNVDLGRTLLARAGVQSPTFPGRDLLAQEAPPATGGSFLEGSYAWGSDRRKIAVVSGEWKLIHRLDEDVYELYDLHQNPAENENLWGQQAYAEVQASLSERLREFPPSRRHAGVDVELDEQTRERLRSLGYTN